MIRIRRNKPEPEHARRVRHNPSLDPLHCLSLPLSWVRARMWAYKGRLSALTTPPLPWKPHWTDNSPCPSTYQITILAPSFLPENPVIGGGGVVAGLLVKSPNIHGCLLCLSVHSTGMKGGVPAGQARMGENRAHVGGKPKACALGCGHQATLQRVSGGTTTIHVACFQCM